MQSINIIFSSFQCLFIHICTRVNKVVVVVVVLVLFEIREEQKNPSLVIKSLIVWTPFIAHMT